MSSSDDSSAVGLSSVHVENLEANRETSERCTRRVESRDQIRRDLRERIVRADWGMYDYYGEFDMVESFLELSQGNNVVEEVYLDPYNWYNNSGRHRFLDRKWEEKLGQAIGNLQSLKVLCIAYGDDVCESERQPPDWDTVACVLRHIWQKITLRVTIEPTRFTEVEFARAFQGHPSIQRFETSDSFDFSTFDILLSALATLPALQSTVLGHAEWPSGADDEFVNPEHITLQHPEKLTTLLRIPSLRSVEFRAFFLTGPVCQAIAHALRTAASPITCLELTNCVFPDGNDSADSIVNALEENTTLRTLRLVGNDFDEYDDEDEGLCHAVTTLLLVNTTLTDLKIQLPSPNFRRLLPPFFMALKSNASLKRLDLSDVTLSDQSLCPALCAFFAHNLVLEELTLHCNNDAIQDAGMASWRTVLSFLQDNKALKCFTFHVSRPTEKLRVAALCCDTVASILEGNSSLEWLDIHSSGITSDAYLSAIESLQINTTLKMLRLYPIVDEISRDDDTKRLIKLVKKNYCLEDIDEDWFSYDKTGELSSILRLNRAGRHYLIQDMGSIAKGVEVLVAVRDHLDCLFYHLLENPLLCDTEHCYPMTGTVVSSGTVHSNKRQRLSN
jgi:hypothetical protein